MDNSKALGTRPNGASCKNCKFCGSLINTEKVIQMICRRESPRVTAQAFPTPQGTVVWTTSTAWPGITDADWCGQFWPASLLSS